MAINLMQGLLTAVILQPRKLPSNQLFAAAGMSAAMPGLLGMLVPLLLVRNSGKTAPVPAPPEELLAVPDVVGRTEKEALAMLTGLSFKVEVKAATVKGGVPGSVIHQQPASGTLGPKGSTVVLSVQPAEQHCQVVND